MLAACPGSWSVVRSSSSYSRSRRRCQPVRRPPAPRGRNRPAEPRPARAPAPPPGPPPPPVREAPLMQCPSILGNGVTTKRLYCDVLGGPEPGAGLRITLPPHAGPLTLDFTLHNRQTYSESEVKAGRAFARYTATLRLASGTGEMLGQAVVRSEFR